MEAGSLTLLPGPAVSAVLPVSSRFSGSLELGQRQRLGEVGPEELLEAPGARETLKSDLRAARSLSLGRSMGCPGAGVSSRPPAASAQRILLVALAIFRYPRDPGAQGSGPKKLSRSQVDHLRALNPRAVTRRRLW